MLVKLHRPPPEIRIFFPQRSERSRRATRRPRFPASMAHIRPAAPPPRIRTSKVSECNDAINVKASGGTGCRSGAGSLDPLASLGMTAVDARFADARKTPLLDLHNFFFFALA